MNSFDQVAEKHFPGYLDETEFVARSGALLRPLGFTADNGFAMVGTCRDELCVPLREKITREWGESFNIASLGGMIFAGRTGFNAAHAHAPTFAGRKRHIYFAMPHLGITSDGSIGLCRRPGIPSPSAACGALVALQQRLRAGERDFDISYEDLEQSLLQMRLAASVPAGEPPDLVQLTLLAEEVIRGDLEREITSTVDAAKVDYAVFTGVQLHGPGQRHYVWPEASYAVVGGERHELSFSDPGQSDKSAR